jgi:chromatin remodeling complex protein RSC6
METQQESTERAIKKVRKIKQSYLTKLKTSLENKIGKFKSVEDKKFMDPIIKDLTRRAEKEAKNNQTVLKINRSTGFTKQKPVRSCVVKFANQDGKVEFSRVELTKLINKYILDHGLQLEGAKSKIQTDETLRELLKIEDPSSIITYNDIQRLLKACFKD